MLRVDLNGHVTDYLRYRTGDCLGGQVIKLTPRPSGSIVFQFGQQSYSSCDDDNRNVPGADIDSHLECIELRWDGLAAKVTTARRVRVPPSNKPPNWCDAE